MKTKLHLACVIIAGCLLLSGCNYDFSLTEKPTHNVDARLLGDWVALDKSDNKEVHLDVRKLDDTTYVIVLDGDFYRVFHSDFADTPFLSVQSLQPGHDDRKYTYFVWQLSADGAQLGLKGISTKVVPDDTKDRAAVQQLIRQNLANPKLFNEELQFSHQKQGG